MKFPKLSIIFALLLAGNLFGQIDVKTTSGYSIVGLTNTQTVGDLLVSSTAPTVVIPVGIIDVVTDAANVAVTATNSARNLVELKQVGERQWLWLEGGKVDFLVEVVDFDKRIWSKKSFSASIPDAPKPDPDPKPDDPLPDGEKLSNLSVLMVYESAQLPAYKQSTLGVINSTEFRKWCNTNLDRDSSGQANFRCLDKDTKFPATCDLAYCKWLGQPPPSLPWLIIGNKEKIAFQGPLPEDIETIKSLVLKYKK